MKFTYQVYLLVIASKLKKPFLAKNAYNDTTKNLRKFKKNLTQQTFQPNFINLCCIKSI